MSMRVTVSGTPSSGSVLRIELRDAAVENLTQNLDWVLLFIYPAIRPDMTWGYNSNSLPMFRIGSNDPESGSKVSFSLSRCISYSNEEPRRVVKWGRLILKISKLSAAQPFSVPIPEFWAAHAPFSMDVLVTPYTSASKVLFLLKTELKISGPDVSMNTIRYGNITEDRERDISLFLKTEPEFA